LLTIIVPVFDWVCHSEKLSLEKVQKSLEIIFKIAYVGTLSFVNYLSSTCRNALVMLERIASHRSK